MTVKELKALLEDLSDEDLVLIVEGDTCGTSITSAINAEYETVKKTNWDDSIFNYSDKPDDPNNVNALIFY